MATPIEPFDESKLPAESGTGGEEKVAPFDQPKYNPLDPAGIWLKFLGPQATVNDVKMFLQGLEKMLQVLVQQNDAAFKRAMDAQKRAKEENG
jgi:hypothetical protein